MTTIVLAAGLSQRMGENKLLLPFKGECILSHTIKRALSFSSRVVVVSGRDREKIEQIALTLGVDMVFNPLFEKGQRESTLCGIRAIENDDFAILPGDLPLIEKEEAKKAIEALSFHSTSRLCHQNIPGHPVFYKKENRDKLLSYPGTMKEYLRDVGCAMIDSSLFSIFDIDTRDKYNLLLKCNGDPSLLEREL